MRSEHKALPYKGDPEIVFISVVVAASLPRQSRPEVFLYKAPIPHGPIKALGRLDLFTHKKYFIEQKRIFRFIGCQRAIKLLYTLRSL